MSFNAFECFLIHLSAPEYPRMILDTLECFRIPVGSLKPPDGAPKRATGHLSRLKGARGASKRGQAGGRAPEGVLSLSPTYGAVSRIIFVSSGGRQKKAVSGRAVSRVRSHVCGLIGPKRRAEAASGPLA